MAAHGLLFPAAYRRTFFFPRTSALLRNRPAKAAFSHVIPRLRLTKRHAMGMESSHAHGNSLMGVLGCGRRLSTFPCAQGHAQRQKAERSENKEFPRVGTRCNAQRLSPLHNKDSRLRGARGTCATPARGRKHASPREPAPTYARKSCLRRSFFPAQCRALHELSSHNGRTQRSRLRFRKNAVSLPKT